MFIKTENTYIGKEGTFLGGRVYSVTRQKLRAIRSDIKSNKMPPFKYTETVAPHLQGASPNRLALESAAGDHKHVQRQLDELRSRQQTLLNKKRGIEDELRELDKLDSADLQKEGEVNRLWRRAKANLELVEIDLEQTAADIKEHAAAADTLEKQIKTLQKKIADEQKKEKKKKNDRRDRAERLRLKEQQTPNDKQLRGGYRTK